MGLITDGLTELVVRAGDYREAVGYPLSRADRIHTLGPGAVIRETASRRRILPDNHSAAIAVADYV